MTHALTKIVWRGLPPAARTPDQAERHYVEVHVPLARRALQLDPVQVAYVTARARARLDAAGGWSHPLDAWRFITFLEDRTAEPGDGEELERLRRLLWEDNPLCIGSSVRCEVLDEVLLDRRVGQSACAKALVVLDRTEGADPGPAVSALVDAVRASAEGTPGARLVTWSRPLRQRTQQELPDGGYALTDWSDDGPAAALVEVVCDNEDALAAALAPVAPLLFDAPLARAAAYLVDERVEFDRRGA